MSGNCRMYCAVYGCLLSSLEDPELSFFRLPGDERRRRKWLQLISREDLYDKSNFASYRVCRNHFRDENIRQSSNRKLLKRNAYPSLNLPYKGNPLQEVKETQTTDTMEVDHKCTQTEIETKDSYGQTTKDLFKNTPGEKRLRDELIICKKKLKLLEATHLNTSHLNKKAEREKFYRLCDTFLTEKLALIVKEQSILKQHDRGNRYDKDFINYCSKLYKISPKAYGFLGHTFCLPCPTTLYTSKFSDPVKKDTKGSTLPIPTTSGEDDGIASLSRELDGTSYLIGDGDGISSPLDNKDYLKTLSPLSGGHGFSSILKCLLTEK